MSNKPVSKPQTMKINKLEAYVLSNALEEFKYSAVRQMDPEKSKNFFRALERLQLKLELMSEDKRRQSRSERVHYFTWQKAVEKFTFHYLINKI